MDRDVPLRVGNLLCFRGCLEYGRGGEGPSSSSGGCHSGGTPCTPYRQGMFRLLSFYKIGGRGIPVQAVWGRPRVLVAKSFSLWPGISSSTAMHIA